MALVDRSVPNDTGRGRGRQIVATIGQGGTGILGMVQKRGLTSELPLDYDLENGFRRGACPRF